MRRHTARRPSDDLPRYATRSLVPRLRPKRTHQVASVGSLGTQTTGIAVTNTSRCGNGSPAELRPPGSSGQPQVVARRRMQPRSCWPRRVTKLTRACRPNWGRREDAPCMAHALPFGGRASWARFRRCASRGGARLLPISRPMAGAASEFCSQRGPVGHRGPLNPLARLRRSCRDRSRGTA
jgi:hypothetical protein